MILKQWIFEGGDCGLCRDKNGVYDFRPGRPHPNCDCTISEVTSDCMATGSVDITLPDGTFQVGVGPGPRADSQIWHEYQIVTHVTATSWSCPTPEGGTEVRETLYEWEETVFVREFIVDLT